MSGFVQSTANLAKGQADRLLAELEIGFGKYTTRNLERCSKIKTLLHRHEPIDIRRAYVAPNIAFSRRILEQTTLLQSLFAFRRIVITGMAGCGKSMFLKHLFVTLCEEPAVGKIPIFLELQNLNNTPTQTLTGYIHSQVSALGIPPAGASLRVIWGCESCDYSQE
jgi:hypothetical protein